VIGSLVAGWGLDVDVDENGKFRLLSKMHFDDDASPVDPVDGPRVTLKLEGGPFHGRVAEWHNYPVVFIALFGDDVSSYVQARRTDERAHSPENEYVFLAVMKLWGK
jgi:hypothetical protein